MATEFEGALTTATLGDIGFSSNGGKFSIGAGVDGDKIEVKLAPACKLGGLDRLNKITKAGD
jgi:hypothetical protein